MFSENTHREEASPLGSSLHSLPLWKVMMMIFSRRDIRENLRHKEMMMI